MAKSADKVAAFRIAMRAADEETGEWWIAYLARIDTMDGSLEIGRIRRSAVEDPKVRQGFIDLMRRILENVLKAKGIKVSEWQQHRPMPPSRGSA